MFFVKKKKKKKKENDSATKPIKIRERKPKIK